MNVLKIITLLNLNILSIVGMILGIAEIHVNKTRNAMLKQETIYLTSINKQTEDYHGK